MNTRIVKGIIYFRQKAILFGPHFNLSKSINSQLISFPNMVKKLPCLESSQDFSKKSHGPLQAIRHTFFLFEVLMKVKVLIEAGRVLKGQGYCVQRP